MSLQQVFLNCPYDDAYKPIFHAIVFAVYSCRLEPRCALEQADTIDGRLRKITSIIKDCRYGLHDVSRIELTRGKYPRFNMPFELGLFLGHQISKPKENNTVLVLDSTSYRHQKTLSDISGIDIQSHQDRPELAIKRVRTWLRNATKNKDIPGGEGIVRRYRRFRDELPSLAKELSITKREILSFDYFNDYCEILGAWLDAEDEANTLLAGSKNR